MKLEIQIFNNEQFGEIRVAGTSEEPLFCAADICRALGYVNGPKAVADHCDTPDVTKRYIGVVTGKKTDGSDAVQNISMTFVSESGLYALIFGSKLESAKVFKRWVTSEVLPAIRKTGTYSIQNISRKELAMMVVKAEEEKEKLMLENQQKQKLIDESKPKVVFADAVVGSKSSCLVGELAKVLSQNGYKIGQNRLFAWMRENGFLGRYGEYYNIPCQRYIEQGLFEIKKSAHSENGVMKTTSTTKVTGKGQQYFINLFLKKESDGNK